MIVYKFWQRTWKDSRHEYLAGWKGWFLFGVLPLYMVRHTLQWKDR